MKRKVVRVNSRAASGTTGLSSACCTPCPRTRSTNARAARSSAPISLMAAQYSSKWLLNVGSPPAPGKPSSDSSSSTSSLMKRRLAASPSGVQGLTAGAITPCTDLISDMKSHTEYT